MEYVFLLACLVAAVGITLIAARVIYRQRLLRRPARKPISVVCVRCRGTGWIEQRERTLEFTGDGFADVEHPATMCQACGGSGQALR